MLPGHRPRAEKGALPRPRSQPPHLCARVDGDTGAEQEEHVGISETAEWHALAEHHRELRDRHLRDLFAEDPSRGEQLTVHAGDLLLDYSKNRLTRETVGLLAALAERAGLRER